MIMPHNFLPLHSASVSPFIKTLIFCPFPIMQEHRISKDMQQLSLLTDDALMQLKWLFDHVIPIGGSD